MNTLKKIERPSCEREVMIFLDADGKPKCPNCDKSNIIYPRAHHGLFGCVFCGWTGWIGID